MHLDGLHHITMITADANATVAFYADVLGLRVSRPGPPDEPVFAGPAGARLGLFADRDPGLRHIALATGAGGYAATLDRLRALEIPHVLDRHKDHASIYFKDPDGHTLEVMTASPHVMAAAGR